MKLLYTLFSLFLATLFLFIGNGLFTNSSNLLLDQANISKTLIGLVNTAYYIGAILSAISAHRIVSRVGHTRSFTFFASIMAGTILCYELTTDLYLWSLLRFSQGFSYYSILMIIESWLNEKSDSSIRSMVLGVYETVFYLAFAIGALLLNVGSGFAHTTILSAIFLLLAIIPISFTKISTPAIPETRTISFPSLFTISPLALIGGLISGFIVNGFFSMTPAYTSSLSFNVQQTSIFLTCAMLTGFLVQLPIGHLSDRFGRRLALLVTSAITCVAAISGVLFVNCPLLEYISAAIFGLGAFSLYPLSLARAHDVLPPNSSLRVEVSRSMIFAYGLGALIAPLSLGVALESLGSIGFDLPIVALSIILFFYTLSQPRVAPEKRAHYVHVSPNSTNTLIANEDGGKTSSTMTHSSTEHMAFLNDQEDL
jgi:TRANSMEMBRANE TRANSPORT PROTEIN-PERMEASE